MHLHLHFSLSTCKFASESVEQLQQLHKWHWFSLVLLVSQWVSCSLSSTFTNTQTLDTQSQNEIYPLFHIGLLRDGSHGWVVQRTYTTQAFPLFWVCGFGELLVVVMNGPESSTAFLQCFWLLLDCSLPLGAMKHMIAYLSTRMLFRVTEFCLDQTDE